MFHYSAITYYDGKSWLPHVGVIPSEQKQEQGERDSSIAPGTAKAVEVQG